MGAVISFLGSVPIWIYLWLVMLAGVIYLFVSADRGASWAVGTDEEEEADGYYCDPAYRVTQSPASRPRVVRGPFKRDAVRTDARPISDGVDGGTAA